MNEPPSSELSELFVVLTVLKMRSLTLIWAFRKRHRMQCSLLEEEEIS